MKLKDLDLQAIVDEVLGSEYAKEFKEDVKTDEKTKVGKDEYYFSEHSLNLSIIDQFAIMDLVGNEKNGIRAYLYERYCEALEEQKFDRETFKDWLNNSKIEISGGEDDLEDVRNTIEEAYRERINEAYPCETCGTMVSERHPTRHLQGLHRIGYKQSDGSYKNKILCYKCYRGT